jgi:hypothetical protein
MSAHGPSPGRRPAWVLPLVIAGCAWGVVIGVAE